MPPKKPTTKQDFIDAGFTVTGGNTENALLTFLQAHYPQIIQDGEVKLEELKTALGLPIDEKVNGYGLNFIGRNVAKAKYAQETQKVLKINEEQSKNFDTTGNLVLRGDNLDSLKILKNYYSGKIKMIYIDPPYNTDSDNFVYPDKFDKEEAEVLGLADLSDNDMERLEFSFGNKKSHNGWLAFMYPRLRLARELLSRDGVIFISIDDNEQANLKLLCDEVFGEGNFLGQIIWQTATDNNPTQVATEHEYVLVYAKQLSEQDFWEIPSEKGKIIQAEYEKLKLLHSDDIDTIQNSLRKWIRRQMNGDDLSGVAHYSYVDAKGVYYPGNSANTKPGGYTFDIIHPKTKKICAKPEYGYRWTKDTFDKAAENGDVMWGENEKIIPKIKKRLDTVMAKLKSYYYEDNRATSGELKKLFDGTVVFNNPKSLNFLQHILRFSSDGSSFSPANILDFFAGSGTTGQAVMQLNAEDGGNRRFILCQIDEPIEKKHAAYEFCTKHKLPPVISSITIERLNRAGEKIRGSNAPHAKTADIGYKVLELTDAPRLEADENLLVTFIDNESLTAQDRLTSLIFRVGVDDPTVIPEEIVKDSLYRIATRYYIVHSVKLDGEKNRMKLKEALIHGEHIYVDGWTATLNTTLQDMRGKGKDKGKLQIVY